MSYVPRRPTTFTPYGYRPTVVAPPAPAAAAGGAASGGALASALGALGGTLGFLLCLSAIGLLGLFSTVVAITVMTEEFLDRFELVENLNAGSQIHIGIMLLFASLLYTIVCRMHRS